MFTAATVDFSFEENGKVINAQISGTTADSGPFWGVTVEGVATTGDPHKYLPMMEAMSKSHRMNPEWGAKFPPSFATCRGR